MLIDDVAIKIKAGDGGKGAVAFNKVLMSLGPVGGSGGKGGSIYFEGVSDLGALSHFRFNKEVLAENGKDGRGQFRDGHDGKDLVLKIPVGTIIHSSEKNEKIEITKIGERILAAKGGRGGKGNFRFRSSTNTSPKESEPGLVGESFEIRLELKLIADVGLIGLPNVGKSSLLNILTKANAKVANYPFTTLEPNLGVYYELILADIPGLIEGASLGKGLGVKFLRHIERTMTLFHLVSAESENPLSDYKIVREELKKHEPALVKKNEYVFVSKSDAKEKEEIKKIINLFKKNKIQALPISIIDDASLKPLHEILNKIKSEKTSS